jgi:predicted CopG family antitoxin
MDDETYDQLEQIKKSNNQTWRELILTLIKPKNERGDING